VHCSGRTLERPGRLHTKTQGQTHCAGEEQEKEVGRGGVGRKWDGKAISGLVGVGKLHQEIGWGGVGWEGRGMGRLHQEIGWGGKGRGLEGYIRRLGVRGKGRGWERDGMGRLHKEIGWGGKGRGWEGYIMRLIEVGKEGDGKDTVHQETGWVGKRRAGDRKATEIGWVRREVDGKEMGSYIKRLVGEGRERVGWELGRLPQKI
jgi:hypothetical protein